MDFEIVELENLSGGKAVVYSVLEIGCDCNLFIQFIHLFFTDYQREVSKITNRIKTMGEKTGAVEHFFKLYEGLFCDGVCAIFDDPVKKLRLFCIRYGNGTIIIGSGGPKTVQKWQQCPVLSKAANQMIEVAQKLNTRIRNGEINFSQNRLVGNLIFQD